MSDCKLADDVETRLAAIVESSSDAIISADLEGTITTWNAGATRLFGYSAPEILGNSMNTLAPPERADEWKEILNRLQQQGRVFPFETVRMAKGGRCIDVSMTVSPVKDPSGQMVGVSAIARDITVRRITDAAMQYSERRYRLLLEATASVVWHADPDGCLPESGLARCPPSRRSDQRGRTLAQGRYRTVDLPRSGSSALPGERLLPYAHSRRPD